jgi:hypothetical protein
MKTIDLNKKLTYYEVYEILFISVKRLKNLQCLNFSIYT